MIPCLAAVVEQSGPWTSPGMRRHLRLSDGYLVEEQVLEYLPPGSFRYRMTGFATPMKQLLHAITGEWRASPKPGGSTEVRWTYRFHHREGAARFFLGRTLWAWKGYMEAALTRVKAAAVEELRDLAG